MKVAWNSVDGLTSVFEAVGRQWDGKKRILDCILQISCLASAKFYATRLLNLAGIRVTSYSPRSPSMNKILHGYSIVDGVKRKLMKTYHRLIFKMIQWLVEMRVSTVKPVSQSSSLELSREESVKCVGTPPVTSMVEGRRMGVVVNSTHNTAQPHFMAQHPSTSTTKWANCG